LNWRKFSKADAKNARLLAQLTGENTLPPSEPMFIERASAEEALIPMRDATWFTWFGGKHDGNYHRPRPGPPVSEPRSLTALQNGIY
jgi:hypothetical protein